MFPRAYLVAFSVLVIVATTVSGNIAGYILHRNRGETQGNHCSPLSSPNTNVTCVLGDKEVACDSNVQPGTIAKAKCKPFFKPAYSELTCLENGEWNQPLMDCTPGYRYIPGNPWGRVTWNEARDSCANKGYELATIKNEDEEKSFKETVLKLFEANKGIKRDNVWIGLTDRNEENTFVWVDGSILNKGDFARWSPGEPSNSDLLEHCVQVNTECERLEDCFHWNDNYCSELSYYFCKESVTSATLDQTLDFGDIPKAKPRYTYLPGNPWDKVTWDEAKDNCQAKGSDLAIIRATDELKLFEESVDKHFRDTDTSPSSVWIGLRSAKVEKKRLFNWVDGSIYNAWRPGNWNNWITKRSNWNWDCTEAAAGDTLKLWPHASIYQWNDVNCTDKNYYFCSIKL